jgi:hypothetical protein
MGEQLAAFWADMLLIILRILDAGGCSAHVITPA